ASARAELRWEKPSQTFHRTPADDFVETKFKFTNAGSAPVTIKQVRSSCNCTTARLPKKTFAPGESGEIGVKFTFGNRKGGQRKIITVKTDDSAQPSELNLVVWIAEPLTLAPALVFWRIGEAPTTKTVRITVDPRTPVRIKAVTSSSPRIAARLETLKAGEQYALQVQPAETVEKEAAQLSVQTDFPPDAPRSYTVHARIK
ncbi:MAG: DUF1573 domain-containing protein, partial [Verrucomicrobiota bacterium]|nr:DUF1573 domain-containing protein [Verrucomicrobiota bacterium]